MIYTKDNLHYCLGVSFAAFVRWRAGRVRQGFRSISISLAGPAAGPICTAVMVKYDAPLPAQMSAKLSRSALDAKIAELAALDRPLHPQIIAATGVGSDVAYAAEFRERADRPYVQLDMSRQDYRSETKAQRAAGRILLWVDAFGSPDRIRYCAIWGLNSDRVAWNAEAINDSGEARQQRFEAMRSINARPALIALTPARGVARLFVDSRLKHGWASLPERARTAFDAALVEQVAAGRFPTNIATTMAGNKVRYAAIFAGSDEILPRSFRIRGPEPTGLSPASKAAADKIDEWMKAYILAHNLRGAALAVVEGTRLVYAKGYTYAEADYDDIEPTTLFRMASVSKTFAALAVWKALADGPRSLNSRMQSILNLRRTDGSVPPPPFGDITIRHLLESNSGILQRSVVNTIRSAARNPNGPTQPLTTADLGRAIADMDMPGTPGGRRADGTQATAYGRTDYFLLGLIAARLVGADNFDAALKTLVLDPLRMTRTRGARTLIEDRRTDEAIHHAPTLATAPSAIHNDRRILPVIYGYGAYEPWGGAAGVTSAVIDVARLGAMLNCRVGNPLFSTAMLDDLLSDAVAATAVGSDKGYHGFDRAKGNGGVIALRKGGLLPGVRAGLSGEMGRRFIAFVRNGDEVAGVPVDWRVKINALAERVDWGAGDLFPQFGMPPLA